MSNHYEPGAVAMVTAYNRPKPYLAVFTGDTWRECLGAAAFCVDVPTSIRALVVLDPEDHEQAERLARASHDAIHKPGDFDSKSAMSREVLTDLMQAALRSLTRPPKPNEPTGLGAVVEDADGDRWVRTFPDGGPAKWRVASLDLDREPWAVWSAISAVRVLSEGVQS